MLYIIIYVTWELHYSCIAYTPIITSWCYTCKIPLNIRWKCISSYLLLQNSLAEEGWYRLTAVLNFSVKKRIQTPQSWFWDFGADKTSTTSWSEGRVQVWVQVWAPAGHLTIIITPEGYSRRKSMVLNAKSMAELLGQRSGTALAASTSTGRLQVGRSRWGQGLLEEDVLPLLLYWLISRVKKILMLC